ncbi:MAG: RNA-guided pseudouridylation complex pseudouridine synthase subunit Cbf5, partial [Nanoarchaeota archaeon]
MNKLPWETKDRTVITKKESVTSEKYGKKPENRTIKELLDSGVISLNKPSGPTSHQAADYAKKILESEKLGHGGTLDPIVSGVLPISINKATKIMD